VASGSNQVKGAANAAGAGIASSSEKIKDSAVSASTALSDRANSLKDDGLRIAGSAASTVQDIAGLVSASSDTIREQASDFVDSAKDALFWASTVSLNFSVA
jgi:hypothetical protein